MGTVFRGHDRTTCKPVAVKVLAQQDADAISRFDHEARVLAELGHPHIVQHVAHGATREGTPYLVMEWLEGQSLAARLHEGRLSQAEAIDLATNVASALAAAHAQGIVHRDVKPSNIFLVNGSVRATRVLDFGLAQAAAPAARLTRTGSVIGTPGYMAPEQAQGSRGRATARVDVFSLGALLFECLTGKPAFEGDDVMAILARVLLEEAPRARTILPDIPEELDTLVARMLSRVPEARPADGAQVLRELEQIGRGGCPSVCEEPRTTQNLGEHENRLVCIVLAAAISESTKGQSTPTLRTNLAQSRANEVQRVATRHGGIASEFAGGGLLVRLHGSDDLLTRAPRCALSLSRILEGSRVALVTGCADTARELPYAELIGRAIQLLEFSVRQKKGNGVRIDQQTAALLDAHFEVEGPSEEPRLCRERNDLGNPKFLLDKPAPFTGRKREVETLVDFLAEGFDEGGAATALVVAHAGMGKSRLAREVLSELLERIPDLVVGIGRPETTGAKYGLVTDLMRHVLALSTGASRNDIRSALLSIAADAQPMTPDILAGFFLEDLDTLDPVTVSPDEQVRQAWLDLLGSLARRKPVLFVVEDAQWADVASMDLLHDALAQEDTPPFGVLALARPDVRERGFGLFSRRDIQEMRLGPLSQKAGREFVSKLVSGSPVLIEAIAVRSEGHPMFLEELIRGSATQRSGFTPETLLAVHGPHMSRLPADAQVALRFASLVGVTFWLGAVLVLQGASATEAELRHIFQQLVTSGIIARRRTSRVPNDIEYVFAQPTVREAFLATWTSDDRVHIDRVVKEWFDRPSIREALRERSDQVYPAKRKK
jgi:eukaryotic-like serine/threonine-protein kinase